jgi:hypothetical protein
MATGPYNWIGTLGGDWAAPLDWSTYAVPGNSATNATIASAGSYGVSVASGELFSIDALTLAVGPTLEIAGGLTLAGTLTGAGTIDIAKDGTLALTGVVGASFANSGLISDSGGLLELDGGLGGAGAIEIASGGTLDLTSATAERVVFGGPSAILALAAPSLFTGTISGFEQTDTIALVGVVADTVSLSGQTLNLLENGATVDTLQLASNYQGASFSLASIGNTSMIFESGITYAAEGPVWASPTITWSFAQSNFASDASNFAYDPSFGTFTNDVTQAGDQAVIEQALSDWAAVTGLTFVEVPDSSTNVGEADIRIGWSDFSGSEIGEADSESTNGNFDSGVLVRLQDPASDPLSAVGGTLIYNNSETSLLQVSLHEIGHALGMAHTDDPDAIMYPVSTSSNRVLDASDIAGIQALYAGDLACFAAGTAIATPHGDVAVERLQVGDRILASGGCRVVVWLGHRSIDCAQEPEPRRVWPVRIAANAFAAGQPARDLMLSPDHAIFYEGQLIPVKYLIDDISIMSVPVSHITYWHVELDAHDIIRAEGLKVESYLDTGNRGQFANADGPSRNLTWQDACAPLCLSGPPIAGLRERLSGRHSLITIDGIAVAASMASPPRYRYLVPKAAREIGIIRPERVRSLVIDGRMTPIRDRLPARPARVVEILTLT